MLHPSRYKLAPPPDKETLQRPLFYKSSPTPTTCTHVPSLLPGGPRTSVKSQNNPAGDAGPNKGGGDLDPKQPENPASVYEQKPVGEWEWTQGCLIKVLLCKTG